MRVPAVVAGVLFALTPIATAAVAQTADAPAPNTALAPSQPSGIYLADPPATADGSKSRYATVPAPGATTAPAAAPTGAPKSAVKKSTKPAAEAALSPEPAPTAQPGALAAPPAAAKTTPPVARKSPAPTSQTALSTDPTPTLQPGTLAATTRAAERYAEIARSGGWPTDITPLGSRSLGPEVTELRKRLSIEGDLPAGEPLEGPAAQIWDKNLAQAVKRFQERMGLKATGVVSGDTLKQINIPAQARAEALAASVQRLSAFNFGFGDRYVVVNLPSTSVEAVDHDLVAHRYVAIVGDPDHPSPQIAAHITQVTLNPNWTVPVSIIKKEIIPRMQRDPGYLRRQRIRILDGSVAEVDPKSIDWNTNRAVNYTLRQDSGAGNSLGVIRINMPNKHAVYMHDTPGKRLFGADYRFLSHGCVRVQGVFDFAQWLLEGSPNADGGAWDKAAMEARVKTAARLDINLEKATPVIWTYLTGWANEDGVAHFRGDVYGLDAAPTTTDVVASRAAVTATAAPVGPVPFPAAATAQ